jgi:formylglycine-generating enzyme required for sulfatase activity
MQSRPSTAPRTILTIVLAALVGCGMAGSRTAAVLPDARTPPAMHRLAALAAADTTPPIREQSLPSGPQQAEVTFLSSPSGATVTLNGRPLSGTTPIDRLLVAPGDSTITFHLKNREPVTLERTWKAGATDRLDVLLLPLVANVTLASTPRGAAVWVNGRRLVEETPVENFPVPAGKSRIEFYLTGYEPVVVEREWPAGTKDRLDVTLPPPAASVTFLSTPPGATVLVNGKPLPDRTPIRGAPVSSGSATIQFQLEGHRPVTFERDWRPRSRDQVQAQLDPLPAVVSFVSTPPGATVLVGGEPLHATTPVDDVPIPDGVWTVEFRLEHYEPLTIEREWRPGASEQVAVELRSTKGTVRFDTPDGWERIEIDGTHLPLAPDEQVILPAGRHKARAYRGDQIGDATFDVAAGGEVTVAIAWHRHGPASDRYVLIPAGRAMLGSDNYAEENPARQVDLRPFWIARYEVTIAEYTACVNAGECAEPRVGRDCNWNVPGRGPHPVNCVNARDAQAYAAWLSARDRLAYALPSADQWERAARGTEGRRNPWGDDPPSGQCNTCDRSCRFHHFKNGEIDDGWSETAPVGTLTACVTSDGIHDLVGNVAEWCQIEGAKGEFGVRGGSWGQIGGLLDPAFPSARPARKREATIGFRLVVNEDAS